MQFVVRHICQIDNRLRACFSRQRPEKLGVLPLLFSEGESGLGQMSSLNVTCLWRIAGSAQFPSNGVCGADRLFVSRQRVCSESKTG